MVLCFHSPLPKGHPYHRLGINRLEALFPAGTNGLIYVVDSNDRDRIEDAREATKSQGPMVRGRFQDFRLPTNDPSISGGSGKWRDIFKRYDWRYTYFFKLNHDYGSKGTESTESMLLLE